MADHYLQSLLGDREEVLLVTRQHWFLFLRSILLELLFSLVIIVATTIAMTINPLLPFWLGFFLLIIPIGGLANDYLNWTNKKYIITNRRVMQISGVFNKNVIDSSLEKVNDVKMSQSFWGRLFDFADIEILTASELGVNQFKTIGKPIAFKTTMLNAKENLDVDNDHMLKRHDGGQPSDITTLILQLDQLRQKGIINEEEFQKKKTELLSKL